MSVETAEEQLRTAITAFRKSLSDYRTERKLTSDEQEQAGDIARLHLDLAILEGQLLGQPVDHLREKRREM